MSITRPTFVAIFVTAAGTAGAERMNFDNQPVGEAPSGWVCGVTGAGSAQWRVEADPQAPSPPNVLTQRGRADFAWCVHDAALSEDGIVAVRFKPMAGKEDQAGGVVWRWKDANTYYVARANALENNVSLYYVTGGVRRTLQYRPAPVAANAWHRIEVRFQGTRIQVLLDDKPYIELMDTRIAEAGKAGVWTKADSVTSFDDFQLSRD